MRKKCAMLVAIVFLVAWPTSFALADTSLEKWGYCKEISPTGNAKYKAVFMDEEVYRYAQSNLADLRIVDSKGEFIPYYVQNNYSVEMNSTVQYDSTMVNTFNKDNSTYIDFRIIPLKYNTDILGNKLSITTPEQNFLKNIEVYGSFDSIEWNYLLKDSIYKTNNYAKLEISLDSVKKYSYYRLKIPNNLEKISVQNLKVIYNQASIAQSSFLKQASLKYEIKSQDKATWVTLFNDNKLKLKQISLDIDGNFDRKYEVYCKADNKTTYLGYQGKLYSQQFKDLNIRNTCIDFDKLPVSSDVIQIKIMNNDDRPLDIKAISETYHTDKLVFEGTPDTYRLYFSNPDALAPKYDIELYKSHIENENQNSCSLGKIITISTREITESKKIDYKIVLNGVIILLSVSMLLIILKKLIVHK